MAEKYLGKSIIPVLKGKVDDKVDKKVFEESLGDIEEVIDLLIDNTLWRELEDLDTGTGV